MKLAIAIFPFVVACNYMSHDEVKSYVTENCQSTATATVWQDVLTDRLTTAELALADVQSMYETAHPQRVFHAPKSIQRIGYQNLFVTDAKIFKSNGATYLSGRIVNGNSVRLSDIELRSTVSSTIVNRVSAGNSTRFRIEIRAGATWAELSIGTYKVHYSR
jgi:hypothetical protein